MTKTSSDKIEIFSKKAIFRKNSYINFLCGWHNKPHGSPVHGMNKRMASTATRDAGIART
jgi:hypothetical protein